MMSSLTLGAVSAQPEAPPVIHYGKLTFSPCTLATPGQPQTVAARCATLSVPEDRAVTGGRRIELAIAWIPSVSKHAKPDPVLFIAGGPGQAALEAYPMEASAAFADTLRQRDLVMVDQRGAGRSHPLACPQTVGDSSTADLDVSDARSAKALAEACLGEIHDADPRRYTTSDYVADLDAVRDALGVAQWNLVGVSYGTRVALEYLRRHDTRVRTLVLDGVVPPPLRLGAEHARNLEHSVNAQFARCDQDATCHEKFGSPRAKLDAVLAQLRAAPRKVSYKDPLTSEAREDTLSAEAVSSVVRLHAYAPPLFAMLPMLLSEASDGHFEGLMAQSRMIDQLIGEQISLGLQISVSCAEDAPGLVADQADRGTLLGTEFVDYMRAQCPTWPTGPVPSDFHAPVISSTPALLLSGEFDPVTPPRYGEEVARTLSRSRHFALRGQGHGMLTVGCVPQLVARFIATADAKAIDGRCLDTLNYAPPFAGPYGWEP
jgi:pimeloyl-ACP methyl ester carboxylesterase